MIPRPGRVQGSVALLFGGLLLVVPTACRSADGVPAADAAATSDERDPALDAGAQPSETVAVDDPPRSDAGARARLAAAELDALRAEIAVVPNPSDTARSADSGAWPAADWDAFRERIRWADAAGLDTLSFRAAVAEMGRTLLGWTYTPATLERPGEERVVVNLRELDCVTYIENVLALTRFQRRWSASAVEADPSWAREAYEALLEEIRYRDGRLAGYSSRLHYFSEWLSDNEARGIVSLRTAELGGAADDEPIDFMSTHPEAYRQLSDPAAVEAIRAVEARLNGGERLRIPQEAIGDVADRIAEGDLIAATSTVDGLDVAHTGIAVRVDGELHLMHAPLVGRAVEISELPLAERILDIRGQDGIMVAEPLPGGR